jgi:hypothetical protein
MVDPVTGPREDGARTKAPGWFRSAARIVVVDGLAGCVLLPLVVLLFGLLALPWIASGLFFYNAVRAAPAASLYHDAPPCAVDGSTGHCVRVLRGTIVKAVRQRSGRAPSVDYQFAIELPSGNKSASVSDFVLAQPPSWPAVGQPVDVTLYGGSIMAIAYNGSQIDTNANPVVHEHDLVIAGLLALAFGLVLEGGVFIRMRRKKPSGQ